MYSSEISSLISNLEPIQKRRPVFRDRFIPLRLPSIGADAMLAPALKTPSLYQQALSSATFGSCKPKEERVFHYSTERRPPRFPSPFIEPQPVLTAGGITDIPNCSENPNQQLLAYCRTSDCMGIILGEEVYLKNGPLIQQIDAAAPKSIALGTQGKTLALQQENGSILFYNLKLNKTEIQCSKTWEIDLQETASRILSQGPWLFLAEAEGRIRRINTNNPEIHIFYQGSSADPIERMIAHPHQKLFLSGAGNGRIDLFHLDNEKPLHSIDLFDSPVRAFAFSPTGTHFLACGDKALVLCAIRNKRMEPIASIPMGSPPTSVFWRDLLAVSTHLDGKVRTFRVDPDQAAPIKRSVVHPLNENGAPILHAYFQCDEKTSSLWAACPEKETLTELIIDRFGYTPKPEKPASRYLEIR